MFGGLVRIKQPHASLEYRMHCWEHILRFRRESIQHVLGIAGSVGTSRFREVNDELHIQDTENWDLIVPSIIGPHWDATPDPPEFANWNHRASTIGDLLQTIFTEQGSRIEYENQFTGSPRPQQGKRKLSGANDSTSNKHTDELTSAHSGNTPSTPSETSRRPTSAPEEEASLKHRDEEDDTPRSILSSRRKKPLRRGAPGDDRLEDVSIGIFTTGVRPPIRRRRADAAPVKVGYFAEDGGYQRIYQGKMTREAFTMITEVLEEMIGEKPRETEVSVHPECIVDGLADTSVIVPVLEPDNAMRKFLGQPEFAAKLKTGIELVVDVPLVIDGFDGCWNKG